MAAPGPRKRSGPALCGAGWARGPAPAAPLGNGVPPHKRPKGPAAGGGEAPEDPFGDGDDFTADELEEIETLASQALSQDAGRGWGGRAGPRGRAAGQEPAGRCEGSGGRWGEPSRAEPSLTARRALSSAGGGADTGLPRDAFRYEVLQTQHEEIRHKVGGGGHGGGCGTSRGCRVGTGKRCRECRDAPRPAAQTSDLSRVMQMFYHFLLVSGKTSHRNYHQR